MRLRIAMADWLDQVGMFEVVGGRMGSEACRSPGAHDQAAGARFGGRICDADEHEIRVCVETVGKFGTAGLPLSPGPSHGGGRGLAG